MSSHVPLSVLRDHAAGARLAPSLAAHLADCPDCAGVLEAERRVLDEVDATLDSLRRADPSPALIARARALADAPAAAPWAASVFRIAAAALVVVGAAATVRQLSWEPSPTPAPTTLASAAELPVTPELAPSVAPTPRRIRRRAVAPPIVPSDQEALAQRFAALVDSGVLDAPERIVRPDESGTPLPEPPELVLPPLMIAAIEAEDAPSEESR
jgi:hypothetical protein